MSANLSRDKWNRFSGLEMLSIDPLLSPKSSFFSDFQKSMRTDLVCLGPRGSAKFSMGFVLSDFKELDTLRFE